MLEKNPTPVTFVACDLPRKGPLSNTYVDTKTAKKGSNSRVRFATSLTYQELRWQSCSKISFGQRKKLEVLFLSRVPHSQGILELSHESETYFGESRSMRGVSHQTLSFNNETELSSSQGACTFSKATQNTSKDSVIFIPK